MTWPVVKSAMVLTQVTNISQRNSSELFYRVLGETAQKWQLVYEDFLLVSTFWRARMALTSSLARSVMSPPDLNPVDYCVWSAQERNVYRGRRLENIIELKEAILQEWEALPQAVINNAIDGFRSRVRLVIAENGQHIEKY